MSPDGRRIAFGYSDARDTSVWVYDLTSGDSARRLTFGGRDRFPIWSSDSQRIIFQSDREGDRALFWQRADGVGAAERLTKPDKSIAHVPQSASPDGRLLLVDQTAGTGPASSLGVVTDSETSLGVFSFRDKSIEPFGGVVSALPTGAVFSPDGRWVAYSTRDVGQQRNTIVRTAVSGDRRDVPDFAEYGRWPPSGVVVRRQRTLLLARWRGAIDRPHRDGVAGICLRARSADSRPFTNRSGAGERPFDAARDGQRFLGLIETSAGSAQHRARKSTSSSTGSTSFGRARL